jgi:hypothetical protein
MTKLKPPVKTRPAPRAQPSLPGIELDESRESPDPMLDYRRRIDADIATIGAAATLMRRLRIAEDEAISATDAANDPRRPGIFAPGDVVVFRARFVMAACAGLRAVKLASEWTVQECACELCRLGEHVCTTQWLGDVGDDGVGGVFRHLARSNIRHRGSLEVDEIPVGLSRMISVPRVAPHIPKPAANSKEPLGFPRNKADSP